MSSVYKSAAGEREVRNRYAEVLAHWPVESERRTVPTRQGDTFVIVSGPAHAPPMVLLHGSAFNSATWMGDVGVWARHFRIYAVDLIGQPGFSAASRPDYDSDAYALWLDDVLGALSIERASLVGLSLGGWIALDYAVRRAARVDSLVLLAPGGVGRERIGTLGVLFGVLPLLLLGAWGRRKAQRRILGPSPIEAGLLPPTEAARLDAAHEFVSLILKHFKPNLAKLARFSDEALASLKMPVLLIVGGRDPMLDSGETAARLERHAADVEIHFLRDAGHALLGQAEPILGFLHRAQLRRAEPPDAASAATA